MQEGIGVVLPCVGCLNQRLGDCGAGGFHILSIRLALRQEPEEERHSNLVALPDVVGDRLPELADVGMRERKPNARPSRKDRAEGGVKLHSVLSRERDRALCGMERAGRIATL